MRRNTQLVSKLLSTASSFTLVQPSVKCVRSRLAGFSWFCTQSLSWRLVCLQTLPPAFKKMSVCTKKIFWAETEPVLWPTNQVMYLPGYFPFNYSKMFKRLTCCKPWTNQLYSSALSLSCRPLSTLYSTFLAKAKWAVSFLLGRKLSLEPSS